MCKYFRIHLLLMHDQCMYIWGVIDFITCKHMPVANPSSCNFAEYCCYRGHFLINVLANFCHTTFQAERWEGYVLCHDGYACYRHLLIHRQCLSSLAIFSTKQKIQYFWTSLEKSISMFETDFMKVCSKTLFLNDPAPCILHNFIVREDDANDFRDDFEILEHNNSNGNEKLFLSTKDHKYFFTSFHSFTLFKYSIRVIHESVAFLHYFKLM